MAAMNCIGEFLPGDVTDVRIVSIRRALRGLERKGIARYEFPGGGRSFWYWRPRSLGAPRTGEDGTFIRRRKMRIRAQSWREINSRSRPIRNEIRPDRRGCSGCWDQFIGDENAAQQIEVERKRLGLTWVEILGLE